CFTFILLSHHSLLFLPSCPLLFFLLTRPPPTSTLFPYTTLFRSHLQRRGAACPARRGRDQTPDGAPGAGGRRAAALPARGAQRGDRKSTRLNSSHVSISYAVFCLKKKKYQGIGHSKKIHDVVAWT